MVHSAVKYGADLTTKQFAVLVVAIALGTLLEWYDYFVYAQLSSYITKVFFPSNDPTVAQLSYWGVYFVGFVSRPIGSIVFGHIGDTRGRRLTLLISVTMMAIPTVLIGCLPTFDQVGVAAPALMAVLRLIQGLAMGGEFGAAMVYLHEVAPPQRKAMTGSIGFCASMMGCTLGVLAVVILEAIFTPAQMLHFGWRIPFLISIISASAAFALRLHMPEPDEFTHERKAIITENLVRVASHRASSFGTASTSFSSRFSNLSMNHHHQHDASHGTSQAQDVELGKQQQRAGQSPEATSPVRHLPPTPENDQTGLTAAAATTSDATISIEGLSEKQGEYVPFIRLLRRHGVGLLLQFLFEAHVSIAFYVVTTWLTVQMRKPPINMPELLVQIMLMVNLLLMACAQLGAGYAADKGMPKIWSCFVVYLISAAISVPVFIGFSKGSVAGSWLLHSLLMVLIGWVLGVVPATCSSIYPPTVRATGFNLGHNMAMSWLGGLSPTIVTSLVAATGQVMLAPGIMLAVAAVVSMLAAAALTKYVPAADGTRRSS